MTVWIIFGVLGLSLLVLGWAVVSTVASLRGLADVLHTLQTRLKGAEEPLAAIADLRARAETLQAPLERAQARALALQTGRGHRSGG
ncbi:MAG: hypothetical protein HKP61_18340 [Dactylosporangium sp.]|nr:hypothetical protein [Dactylosporangium sp.]NNJ62856.1 hypothetical protein [Dactylosporangium sp.]